MLHGPRAPRRLGITGFGPDDQKALLEDPVSPDSGLMADGSRQLIQILSLDLLYCGLSSDLLILHKFVTVGFVQDW